jgi:hypothetical protein
MKIRKLAFLSTLFAILLPMLVVATVVISYTYPISVSNTSPVIYLAQGPNYGVANSMGLISVTNSTSNGIMSQTITLKNVTGSYNVQLLNVLSIFNKTGWDTAKAPVYVYINVSGLSHVAVGYSTSQVNWFTSATNITSSSKIQITTSGTVLYLSFLLWTNGASSVTFTGTVTIQYYVV